MSITDNSPKTKVQKNWWAPIWKGLVMDPMATHYKTIGPALWLFIYFVLNAERRTGFLLRKTKTIGSDMGMKERTIRAWLKILRKGGYIRTAMTGHSLRIQIEKWKSLAGCQDIADHNDKPLPTRVTSCCQPRTDPLGQNSFMPSDKLPASPLRNDISIKRNILKDDIGRGGGWKPISSASKERYRGTAKELLALELAKNLDDLEALSLYRSYVNRYPEWLLRKVLGEAMKTPANKIKKSRGALFNHLIRRYDK